MSGQERAEGKGRACRPEQAESTSVQQYFAAEPMAPDVRHTIDVDLRGREVSMVTSAGVFSQRRLDTGTSVLLRKAPRLPGTGTFLDLGCGWGPISVAMGLESPDARVWAVDVNERAVTLTRLNATRARLRNVHAVVPADLPAQATFDVIWSNPPIRVGKEALHRLLMAYLPRLGDGGMAYLVVQRNLGADSLIPWLEHALDVQTQESGSAVPHPAAPSRFSVRKYASSKGYRLIEVRRLPTTEAARD